VISIEEYEKIKKKADERRNAVAQAEGALEQLLKDLKEHHGCDSIEAAEALLAKLEKEEKELEAAYNTEVAAYKEKWGELLK
jgi:hypothetical protein